jgi:uncharacterized damage-inducible protein DinB
MKDHFNRLNEYNRWANRRVLDGLKNQTVPEKALALLSHIVLAESVWQMRLLEQPVSTGVFDVLSLEEIDEMMTRNEAGWTSLLESTEDYNRKLDYKMLNGTPVQSSISDILTHIFNHGTYHRAQIASLLRQFGLDPASTDFISFSRLG